jgi:hypothetical protein
MRRIVQFALVLHCAAVYMAAQPIGILFDFGTQPEPAIVELMKSEIREILAPARLDLSFQRVGESGASQPFRKVVIVRFHGSCHSQVDAGGIQSAVVDYPALATTDISAGRILPYVQVYCNQIRAFLPSVSRISFARMYGRALGRVVVHELYHTLLSTSAHSRTGVARFAQSARDLTRDSLLLDTRSIGRLHDLYAGKEKEGDSEEPPSNVEPTIVRPASLKHQP